MKYEEQTDKTLRRNCPENAMNYQKFSRKQ